MKERILYIDMAKGFAMITIVMLHVTLNNFEGDSCIMINSFNHSFNTRLLFFLSGMVAALGGAVSCNWRDIRKFVTKKVSTLLLPYFIWGVVVMPFIFEGYSILDFSSIFMSSFTPPFNGYWFLLYLFAIQMLFLGIKIVSSWLSTFVKDDFMREVLVVVPLSLLLFPIYEYFLIFMLGYFFSNYGSSFLFSDAVQAVSFCLFFALFAICKVSNGEMLRFIMALSAVVTIVGIMRRLSETNECQNGICEFLCNVGRHSLEIYLLHYSFTWIFRDIHVSVASLYAIPLYLMIFVISTFICLLCCYIADGMKKIPYVSFLLFGGR